MSLMNRLLCAVGWHEWRCYDAVDATPHTVRWMYRCTYCPAERSRVSHFYD